MNGRERLAAWAETLPDDFVKQAVRDAERVAIDNLGGDDEHNVFVSTLIAHLGLKRPNRRPKKLVDYDETKALLEKAIPSAGDFSYASVNAIVAKHFGITANTAQKHTMPLIFITKLLRGNKIESLIPPRIVAYR